MIKAVIFDFDDTLCLTEEACFHLENETLAKMGRPPMSRARHQASWGEFLGDAILKRSPGVDVEEFTKIHKTTTQEYIESGKFDVVSEDNLNALDELVKNGFQVMVLTGRAAYEVEHLMNPAHHLGSRIANFYNNTNNPYHKPDPRTFEIIEKDHGLKPDECVYVGDLPSDGSAAQGAGLHFMACLEAGLWAPKDFAGVKVDVFLDKLSDITKAVEKLQKT